MRDQASRPPTHAATCPCARTSADARADTHTCSITPPYADRPESSALECGATVADDITCRILAGIYSRMQRIAKKTGLENGLR